MKGFEMLFGTSELILRLPNILAHLLYLVFTYKLFAHFCDKFLFPLFFIAANLNPFLLDFFSLARGYGIAIGLMTTGLYFYCRYLEVNVRRHHILALTFMAMASLANFALINLFLILILVHNFFKLIYNEERFTFKKLWNINKENATVLILLSIVLYEPIRKMFKFHLIDFGGENGFWEDTVRSLTQSFAYSSSNAESITIIFNLAVILFFALFIIRFILYLKNKKPELQQKLVMYFGLTISLVIIFSEVQHLFFNTPFLMGRFAVFIYPLFIFMSCFLINEIFRERNKFLALSLSSIIGFIFMWHCICSLNRVSYFEWRYDMDTKRMLTDLDNIRNPKNAIITLGISWTYEPTINFYRELNHLTWLNKVDRQGFKPSDDYYYTDAMDMKGIPKTESELIHEYPESGNYLLKKVQLY